MRSSVEAMGSRVPAHVLLEAGAVDRARPTGAALVEHDEVAVLPDGLEVLVGEGLGDRARRLARAAGEGEDRGLGGLLRVVARHREVDRPCDLARVVERDPELPAVDRLVAGVELQRGGRGLRSDRREGEDEEREEAAHQAGRRMVARKRSGVSRRTDSLGSGTSRIRGPPATTSGRTGASRGSSRTVSTAALSPPVTSASSSAARWSRMRAATSAADCNATRACSSRRRSKRFWLEPPFL